MLKCRVCNCLISQRDADEGEEILGSGDWETMCPACAVAVLRAIPLDEDITLDPDCDLDADGD